MRVSRMTSESSPIIVALDTTAEQAISLARQLQGEAQWLKVGMTLFYHAGPQIVADLKSMGYRIFVDLKLNDIPHQVRGAAHAVALAGADMLTVHASGGLEMMRAACDGAEEGRAALCASQRGQGAQSAHRPICLAITVLTSLDDEALLQQGVSFTMREQVLRMADLAKLAGMDGLVCSPMETQEVRKRVGEEVCIVTPGVRPKGSTRGDQARVATPAQALAGGADYLVIGRPITGSDDPRAAFKAIVEEIHV